MTHMVQLRQPSLGGFTRLSPARLRSQREPLDAGGARDGVLLACHRLHAAQEGRAGPAVGPGCRVQEPPAGQAPLPGSHQMVGPPRPPPRPCVTAGSALMHGEGCCNAGPNRPAWFAGQSSTVTGENHGLNAEGMRYRTCSLLRVCACFARQSELTSVVQRLAQGLL